MGRPEDNSCLVIKRVPLKQKATSKLQFIAPDQPGKQELSLYFMCDSWNDCNQVSQAFGFMLITCSCLLNVQPYTSRL